jgi:LEA14-like dessication related protein
MRLLTLLLFTGICLFGCGVRAPLTQFTSSTITNTTSEAIEMDVEFEISNTNDLPIRLMMYNYAVTADGRTVFTGKSDAQLTVPRWSTTRSSIPVVIRKDVMTDLESVRWELSGSLSYVPPSAFADALRTSGLWETSTRVHAQGVFSTTN